MSFNNDIYYGSLIKGDLHGAVSYMKQFPEQIAPYHRFLDVYEQEQYIIYDIEAELNEVLLAYQQYYRNAFYLCIGKEQSAGKLKEQLAVVLGITNDEIELCDLEQNQLVELFQRHGLHFLGGKTGGYYGPYVWQSTETMSYDVELPTGVYNYALRLLDGFIMRSWLDYLSFGEIGSGGWVDSDGCISCVRSAWNFESESFRVSLLKHEAQHARDLEMDKDMSSEDLEYRAKLVELIYSSERNLLQAFIQEASDSDKSNGHAMAAYRIMKEFINTFGWENVIGNTISVEQIQFFASKLFADSEREHYF